MSDHSCALIQVPGAGSRLVQGFVGECLSVALWCYMLAAAMSFMLWPWWLPAVTLTAMQPPMICRSGYQAHLLTLLPLSLQLEPRSQ